MRKVRKEELLHEFPAIPDEIMEQMRQTGGRKKAANFAVMLTWGRELFVRCYHHYCNGEIAERQRYVFAEDGSVRYGSNDGRHWEIRKEVREPVFCKSCYGYSFDNSYMILNRKALAASCMKHSQLEHYKGNLIMEYLHLYCKHRNLEYLMKSGYSGVVEETYTYNGFFREQEHLSIAYPINWKTNNLLKMLNLNRTEFKALQGSEECYLTYIYWRKIFPKNKPKELLLIGKIFGNEHGTLSSLCELTKLRPYRIAVYLDENKIRLSDYHDYIDQCRKLHYNLHDTAINMPHHFMDMHTRLTEIINLQIWEQAKERRRKQEAIYQEKLKQFEKNMVERLSLEYQSENLMIRLPRSIGEITQEGAVLHHCVGGYAERHAEGKLHILFIRQAENPNVPFYTMEVTVDGKIKQVRGLRNSDPTPEVAEFVEKYKVYLQAVFVKRKLMESVA
ncbi:MAG: PcfJ domain-containing protein [Oscillospiraceae bacterium]|nr:PcfJ domain-containing protein [Oscillospiraceae bacterium]